MAISVFDLFKIGVGPSSSHTVGPMRAGALFVEALREREMLAQVQRIEVRLYGSLAATGIGHGTDKAVIMGLMGEWPDKVDPLLIEPRLLDLRETQCLLLAGELRVPFVWQRDMQLLDENLPYHPNAMTLSAFTEDQPLLCETYFALAVNEENAAGGRMVTVPTNGAAGIIPAVLLYYMKFCPEARDSDVVDYFLAAAAVGILCKRNASISGAEVGCQGEVGSACAMAAAGLAEILGASPEQVENAAEIGLEHNLGLTCDPVGGLVQVPCIERNAIAAVKAINAAQMALRGDGTHFISLDRVIRTMRDTGADMHDKYKETSRGGLAVSSIEC
jgi:L-serine deaminase